MSLAESRAKDAARKRIERAEKAVYEIPRCADPELRARLEEDAVEWLLYIFGEGSEVADPFTYEPVAQQVEMINAFDESIRTGQDIAVACPRGGGKTTIAERVIVRLILMGKVDYCLLLQAAGSLALSSLETIKTALTENPLIRELYPEAVGPIHEIGGSAQRAPRMVASGYRHDTGERFERESIGFSWKADSVVLPAVPGSPSHRAIIATKGLDSAIRGIKRFGKRPTLVVLDDPDTIDSARSEMQAEKLREQIDKAIGGLGGQQRPCARVMLTTIQSRISASAAYTDPDVYPSWNGRRFQFVEKMPDRLELWLDDYVPMRQEDWRKGTTTAHDFYIENFDEMNAGAAVSNPHRHFADQETALQFYFDFIARNGEEAALTELQNEPPEVEAEAVEELTANAVISRLSGYPRGVVPHGASALTLGVDVGKYGLHWVAVAFMGNATAYVVDYGFAETQNVKRGSDQGVEHAIRRCIQQLADELPDFRLPEHIKGGGEVIEGDIVPVDVAYIDSRYEMDAVLQGVAAAGPGWWPIMGHGTSSGNISPAFAGYTRNTDSILVGYHAYAKRRADGGWTHHLDADFWKQFVHHRWLTPMGEPGAMYLFGETAPGDELLAMRGRMTPQMKDHLSFGKHQVAELYRQRIKNDKLIEGWVKASGKAANHWLDALAYACAAAALSGVRLMKATVTAPKQEPKPKAPSENGGVASAEPAPEPPPAAPTTADRPTRRPSFRPPVQFRRPPHGRW